MALDGHFLGGFAQGQQQLRENKFTQQRIDQQDEQLAIQKQQAIQNQINDLITQGTEAIKRAPNKEAADILRKQIVTTAGRLQRTAELAGGVDTGEAGAADAMQKYYSLLNVPSMDEQQAMEQAKFDEETKNIIRRDEAQFSAGTKLRPQREEIKPNFQNFADPNTGKQVSYDLSTTEGLKSARDAVQKGYVEVGTTLQGGSSDVFNITKKEGEGLTGLEIQTQNFIDLSNKMIQQVNDPDTLSGGAATIATTLNGMVNGVKQLSEAMGSEDDEPGILDANQYDFNDIFGDQAPKTAALKSNQITLAYLYAKSRDPSGRVAKDDMENALKAIGDTSNKESMRAVLLEVQDNVVNNFNNTFRILNKKAGGELGDLPVFERNLRQQEKIIDFNDLKKSSGK